ncbi:uncharacterized protein LOC111831062 [Capsella rubella]|uniref:uncharacterized protein LOC111831062 n=1 Tax=Capsella rubella TaxID=81985 RepID=UPI000CD57AD8|nr:uncharacterized protein LOC111831062 [Capsella rubella]
MRWNSLKSFSEYVGGVDSFHNNAVMKREYLMKQGQSIEHALHKQDDITKNEYRIRMNASVDASRYLLQQGLAFRGHDESEKSASRENFVELIKYTANQNEVMKQMAVVFRFVDKSGIVKEIFMTITHVSEISATALKFSIDDLFAKYGLSIRKVRGQGFYGASNMKGHYLSNYARLRDLWVYAFYYDLQILVVFLAFRDEVFDEMPEQLMPEIHCLSLRDNFSRRCFDMIKLVLTAYPLHVSSEGSEIRKCNEFDNLHQGIGLVRFRSLMLRD